MTKNFRRSVGRLLLLVVSLMPGAGFAAGPELVANGSFSSGSSSWAQGVYGGAASAQVLQGEYVTTITQAGSLPWHVQLIQGNITLAKGKTYELRFRARANSPRVINVNVGENGNSYKSYSGGLDVSLGTSMQEYTITFKMQDAGWSNSARIEFNSGLSAITWYLDDVHLAEVPAQTMILNGSFDVGATGWFLGVYEGAVATGGVNRRAYSTAISKAGSQPWHVQLTQSAFKLVQGRKYQLQFSAGSESNRQIDVNVGMAQSPYVSYSGTSTINLSPGWQVYTKTFVMSSATDENARLEFNSGLSDVDWYLDNVSLVEVPNADLFSSTSTLYNVPGTGYVDYDGNYHPELQQTVGKKNIRAPWMSTKAWEKAKSANSSGFDAWSPDFLRSENYSPGQVQEGAKYTIPTSAQSGGGQWVDGVNTQTGRYRRSIDLGVINGTGGLNWPIALHYLTPPPMKVLENVRSNPTSPLGYGWNMNFPYIATFDKGTIDYGDDEFFADLGAMGNGVLVTDDGISFSLSSDPTIKIKAISGSNPLNHMGWVVTLKDGTTIVLGGRDDAIRRRQSAGDRVVGSFWNGTNPNTNASFAYRWDVSEIRAPLNRGIVRFGWHYVLAKDPAYRVESQIGAIWSCSPNYTVADDLAKFDKGEIVLDRAEFTWGLKGNDEVFVATSAMSTLSDYRLFVESRYLKSVVLTKGSDRSVTWDLQYKILPYNLPGEAFSRRFLSGIVPTYYGLAPEKDQWWFRYDSATGWMRAATNPDRTVDSIETSTIHGRMVYQDEEIKAYTGKYKGDANISRCVGDFCYDIDTANWSVVENSQTVCAAAGGMDFRVYRRVGESFRMVLDREFWQGLGKCPPTHVYPAGDYFVVTWGQGRNGATNFSRLSVFQWDGRTFVEKSPFEGDADHANLPIRSVYVAEDWFLVTLMHPGDVTEFVPVIRNNSGNWASLNRNKSACDVTVNATGISGSSQSGFNQNWATCLGTWGGVGAYVHVSNSFLKIFNSAGGVAILRKSGDRFDNTAHRLQPNASGKYPWTWQHKAAGLVAGDDWVAVAYRNYGEGKDEKLFVALWRWNGREWKYQEVPFYDWRVPINVNLSATGNGLTVGVTVNLDNCWRCQGSKIAKVAFPVSGDQLSVWAASLPKSIPDDWNGSNCAKSDNSPSGPCYGNHGLAATNSFFAIQVHRFGQELFENALPPQTMENVADPNNRYYSYLYRDGINVSEALVDQERAPLGLTHLLISPDEKWLIGKSLVKYDGFGFQGGRDVGIERIWVVPISADRSLPNRGIGAPDTWRLLSQADISIPTMLRYSISNGVLFTSGLGRLPKAYPIGANGPSSGPSTLQDPEWTVVKRVRRTSLHSAESKEPITQSTEFAYHNLFYNSVLASPVAMRGIVERSGQNNSHVLNSVTHEYYGQKMGAYYPWEGYNHSSIAEAAGRLKKSTETKVDGSRHIVTPEYRWKTWYQGTNHELYVIDPYRFTNVECIDCTTKPMTTIDEQGMTSLATGDLLASASKRGGTTAEYGEGTTFRHTVSAWQYNSNGQPTKDYSALYKSVADVNAVLSSENPTDRIESDFASGKCKVQSAQATTYVNGIDPLQTSAWGLVNSSVDNAQLADGVVLEPPTLQEGWQVLSEVNQKRSASGNFIESITRNVAAGIRSNVVVYEGDRVMPSVAFTGAMLQNCAAITAEDGGVGFNNNYVIGSASQTDPRWEIDPTKVAFDRDMRRSGQYSFRVTDSKGPSRDLYLLDSPELANGIVVSAWIYSAGAMPKGQVLVREGTNTLATFDVYPDNALSNTGFKPLTWQQWKIRLTQDQISRAINSSAVGGNKNIRISFGTNSYSGGNVVWVDDIVVAPANSSYVISGYDTQGRLISREDQHGLNTSIEYDVRGRTQAVRDNRGRIYTQGSVIPAREN